MTFLPGGAPRPTQPRVKQVPTLPAPWRRSGRRRSRPLPSVHEGGEGDQGRLGGKAQP
jgi:hypothetical protein